MRISDGVTPPGGWKYLEGTFWIYGKTGQELVTNLTAHRNSNHKPVGQPWQDITNQVLEKYPSFGIN